MQQFGQQLSLQLLDLEEEQSNSNSDEPQYGWTSRGIDVFGIGLYAGTALVLLPLIVVWRLKAGKLTKALSLSTFYYCCLPVFLICRVVWWIFTMNNSPASETFTLWMNRIALSVYLVMFNTIIAYWWDVIHTTIHASFARAAIHSSLDLSFISTTTKVLLWLCTSFLVLFTLGTTLGGTIAYHGHPPESALIYRINVFVLALAFLFYSGAFLFLGTKLFLRLKDNTTSGWIDRASALVLSVALCCLFLLRAVMFSLNLLFGITIAINSFLFWGYIVPELLPVAIFMYAINTDAPDDDSDASAGLLSNNKSKQTPSFSETGSYNTIDQPAIISP